MSRNEGQYRRYNRILLAVGLTVLVILTLLGMGNRFPVALALEQQARCGIKAHIHAEDCYVGDVLLCGKRCIPTAKTVIWCCCRTTTSTGCSAWWPGRKTKA